MRLHLLLFFGGDWERQYDRFLIGGGNTYKIGEQDGRDTVYIDTENLPNHAHMIGDPGWRLMIWMNLVYQTNSGLMLGTIKLRIDLFHCIINGEINIPLE